MTTLERLTIKNFRGFDSLEIDGFSQINLFVGKNNSGKTSVLEAVYFLLNMSDPLGGPCYVNKLRGLGAGKRYGIAKELSYLFHKLSLKNKPSFYGKFSNAAERWLDLNPLFPSNSSVSNVLPNDSPQEFQQSALLQDIPVKTASDMNGIELAFARKADGSQKQTYKSSIVFESDNAMIKSGRLGKYQENLHSVFLRSGENDGKTLARLSDIVKKKGGDKIFASLRDAFSKNIVSVEPLADGIYFNLQDVDEYIPSNIMGDGVRRFLNIVTAVAEKPNSFVCIDEIENGLHYSAYKHLWKSLVTFSKQNNVQLFITTHNIETLISLKLVLEENDFSDMQTHAKVFTLAQTTNAGHKVYRYSFEGFKDAIDHDMEIRN